MSTPTPKEKILSKIKQALVKPVEMPFANRANNEFVFQPSKQELEIEFAENFIHLQGKFSFCANYNELVQQLQTLAATKKWEHVICKEDAVTQNLIKHGFNTLSQTASVASCDAAITSCEALVARTGSILLSSATQSGRTASVYAPIHICIATTKQLVYDISNALALIKEKYQGNLPSVISLATGPSRTADIEKTLVVGVHGPKEVFCFLIEK